MDVLHNLKQKFHYTTKLDYIATVDGVQTESVLISMKTAAWKIQSCYCIWSTPRDNSVVNFAVYEAVDNFSKIETQEFTGDGSTAQLPH